LARKLRSLDALIADLDFLEKNFDRILQEKYDNIMAMVMVAIGKATAYDTGVSRDLVFQILCELNRADLAFELNHVVYEFWKTYEKRDQEPHGYTFKKENGRYFIEIIDYGFYNQQEYGKVSDIHPRNDKRVVPHQVDYGIDLMETGTDKGIEKAFKDLENLIVQALDGVI
jgi:hypothetical protein